MASDARSVASSASRRASSGGVLPPWAASTATPCWASASSRSSPARASSAVSHASCAAFSASATARADAAAGAGAGCSGLPQHGAGEAGPQLRCELGGGVGEPFLAKVEPALPAVLVLPAGEAVACRNGATRRLCQGITPDQDNEFLGRGGLLLRTWTSAASSSSGRTPESSASDSARSPARAAARVLRPASSCSRLRTELGDAGMQTAEPALVRQPFLKHRADGPQSPQRGPQTGPVGNAAVGSAVYQRSAGTFRRSVRRPVPERREFGVCEGSGPQFFRR